MKPFPSAQIWFVAGSQHLYGPAALRQVAANADAVVRGLGRKAKLPAALIGKGVMTDSERIVALCREANANPACAGLILWMHTFSPGRQWVRGLQELRKPFLHLHTQFHRDLPWATIDMDFMNLHQAAHGDREAGFLHTRLGLRRKIVAGYWEDPEVLADVASWTRAARAWLDWQGARFARFGDNMRQVSVTDGDKLEAEARLGFSVDAYGVGDLVAEVKAAKPADVKDMERAYARDYRIRRPSPSITEAARIEVGLRAFLGRGGFAGFTTNFEDLHGLHQLTGLPAQRLMAEGCGFGAEGDWKTCALVRAAKVMADGRGGTSFMEDYTYHFGRGGPLVLGAHMLEICPSIAAGRPSLEVHPLSIGGKADPARLVFDARSGPATNAALVDMGDRFRLVATEVDVIRPPKPLPRLPVARAVWTCRPDFKTATERWIAAGGGHHTALSYGVGRTEYEDFARIAGLEFLLCSQS
ncbi:MAG TPA: L-arabinose isomerase [Opitutaceae bacterium]|jgi:L-arabinose isomerase|nr:L-arabinose isomerase [Opitutaceae bacterium]